MRTELKLAIAAVGALAAYDLITSPLRRNRNQLAQNLQDLSELTDQLAGQNKYMIHLLKVHDVPMTEFDAIAMNNPDVNAS